MRSMTKGHTTVCGLVGNGRRPRGLAHQMLWNKSAVGRPWDFAKGADIRLVLKADYINERKHARCGPEPERQWRGAPTYDQSSSSLDFVELSGVLASTGCVAMSRSRPAS